MTDGLILQIRDKNRRSVLRHTQRREVAAYRHLMVKITEPDRNARADSIMEWQLIATAPFDRDLELAVINYNGTHTFVFPCRRILRGWMKAESNTPIILYPTHWREWHNRANPHAFSF
jgi:hypothetical protein